MKNLRLFSFLMILASSLMFVNCTSDPEPGIPGVAGADGKDGKDGVDGVSTGPGSSTTVLLAKKAFLGPKVDGVVDASWANVQELVVTAKVPDPGNDVFKSYVDQEIDIIMKAQYDDEYIYFLAEWKDGTESKARDTWYFDPATSLWKQESNKPVFNEAGEKVREAFYEDKFALLFDVNESVPGWDTQTCYASCHTGLTQEEGFARHYTEAAGQVVDMWHWKYARTDFYGTFDDQNQTHEFVAPPVKNGRWSDAGVNPSPDNKQALLLDGTGVSVNVPKYAIPGRANYGWITKDEIDNNTAKLITAVGSDGKLTFAGGVIDPVADVNYQRDGANTALYGMPSIWVQPVIGTGSRADILSASMFTGNGWVLEFKRKLDTGDHAKDVTFDITKEYPFGLGIFENAAIAHAIKAFLTLKFQQ